MPIYRLLSRLGLLDAPRGTTLTAGDLSLRGTLPLWLAFLLLLGSAVFIFWLYWSEHGRLSRARRMVLASVRFLLLALVLGLLLRPVLLAEYTGTRARPVVVLLDDTESLKQIDRRISTEDRLRVGLVKGLFDWTSLSKEGSGRTDRQFLSDKELLERTFPRDKPWVDLSRLELLQTVLNNEDLDLLDKLNQRGPLRVYRFADSAQAIQDTGPVESLKADGKRTALADVIHELLNTSGTDLPAALVLASDGRDNASKRTMEEAANLCREKGVPIHVYGLGTSQAGILQIKDVIIPDTVFIDEKSTSGTSTESKDDPVEVPIRYRLRGFKGGKIQVRVQLGDKIEEKFLPIGPGNTEGEDLKVVVPIVPTRGKEGPRDLVVTLEVVGQPSTREEYRRTVQVKTSRVKVLYVENTPRREYKFIQPALDRDRRLLMRYFLVEGDPQLAEAGVDKESGTLFLDRFPITFPEATTKDPDRRPYDLLILGDVPLTALGSDATKRISRFVREGGGLLMIAGKNYAPSDMVSTELAKLLPVEIQQATFSADAKQTAQPFRPVLTYEGEASPVMALADRPAESLKLWKEDLWRNIPGFFWHYPVKDLKPGAVTLLAHPDKKIGRGVVGQEEQPMPLIARHYFGRGEVMFVGIEETWRLRDGTGDLLTSRLWGQIALQLGLPHLLGNDRRSQMELERSAQLGRPSTLKARLLDVNYEPIKATSVQATLVHLDAAEGQPRTRPLTLHALKRQPGEYRGTLPNDVEGRYQIQLGSQTGVEPGMLSYQVELPPRHERERAPLDEAVLRTLAERSGGTYYREEDLASMPELVKPQQAEFVVRQEVLLWNTAALLLFLLLITGEWLLRKFSNLS